MSILITAFLMVSTLLFTTLKLCNVIDWSWWFVLLPAYIPVIGIALGLFAFFISSMVELYQEKKQAIEITKQDAEQKERERKLSEKFQADREQLRKEINKANEMCETYDVKYNHWSKTFTDERCNVYVIDENDTKKLKLISQGE